MRSLYDTSAVFSIICRSASAARENRSRGIKAMVTKRCAEEVSASLKLTRVYSLAFRSLSFDNPSLRADDPRRHHDDGNNTEGRMKRSIDRILTTHAGSMPRPQDLVDMIATKRDGGGVDETLFAKRVREAVDEGVRKQAEAGIDIVSDGEMGKPSFVHYVRDRIAGFEGVEDRKSVV